MPESSKHSQHAHGSIYVYVRAGPGPVQPDDVSSRAVSRRIQERQQTVLQDRSNGRLHRLRAASPDQQQRLRYAQRIFSRQHAVRS